MVWEKPLGNIEKPALQKAEIEWNIDRKILSVIDVFKLFNEIYIKIAPINSILNVRKIILFIKEKTSLNASLLDIFPKVIWYSNELFPLKK